MGQEAQKGAAAFPGWAPSRKGPPGRQGERSQPGPRLSVAQVARV